MKYENIPKTDIKISKIGYGTRTLNINMNEGLLRDLIDKILDMGINFFCTSANYQEGRVEQKLGQLLSGIRDKVVIATSGGVYQANGKIIIDSSPARLESSILQSLKNLKTDYLDHFEIHIYDPLIPVRDTLEFLNELLESNIIKSVGTSCFIPEILKQWEEYIPTSLVQVPLNPLQVKAYSEVLPVCKKYQIGILIYSPLFAGLFSKHIRDFPISLERLFNPSKKWKQVLLNISNELMKLSKEEAITIPELVLNWIISNESITSILVGSNNVSHLKQNTMILDQPVSSSVLKKIKSIIHDEKDKLKDEDLPKFCVTIKRTITNSYGENIGICESGLKIPTTKAYSEGTLLELDIETGKVLTVLE